MRRPPFVLALAALLIGCSDPVADAERELAIVLKSRGTNQEICDAKRKVAAAYLKAQDERNYTIADLDADGACMEVTLDHLRR